MSTDSKREAKVVIIGAGVAGIATAISLKDKLGFTNFQIYEKASEVGGTWRDNIYPGCACDVPVHWYSLSTELKYDWSKFYADQPEILEYWKAVAQKHNLYSKIAFNTNVNSLTWNEDRQIWVIQVVTGQGIAQTVEAEIVVSAGGGFALPNYANIKGMDSFQGPLFHSARWDYGIDLRGKTVGVIGNGCSAAQFIPKISEDPSVKVINFCRTPNWFVPRRQYTYPAIAKFLFKYIPFLARFYRNSLVVRSDFVFILWKKRWARLRALAEKIMLRYMRKAAPVEYHDTLTPKYPIGCKRIIIDPGYYKALHRPNVDLVYGGVQEITNDGVITGNGEAYKCDVIICSTGFLLVNRDLHVKGRKGVGLYDYFESRGGPEAYKGTTVPGFPNFFFLLGPNVASGHVSALFSEEVQISYLTKLIEPVIKGKARSFEVRREVSENYNVDIQRRLNDSTWSSCASYYRDGNSVNGKIIATFPGSLYRQWYILRKVYWSDYIGVEAEAWGAELKRRKIRKIAGTLAVGALCTGLAFALKLQDWRLDQFFEIFLETFTLVKKRFAIDV